MDLQSVVTQLKSERDRIDQAIAALEGPGSTSVPRRGRPPKNTPAGSGQRRHMSAAARKRISEGMKARWAQRSGTARSKASQAKSAKKATGRSGISAAGRKRLSVLMKARWAARKRQAKTS